jgi:hypothetical protein
VGWSVFAGLSLAQAAESDCAKLPSRDRIHATDAAGCRKKIDVDALHEHCLRHDPRKKVLIA